MKRKHITAAVLVASLAVSSMMAGTVYAAEPTTTVAQGELRGFMDGDVYTFLGVPYAYVPERFALPEDPQPWEGVRNVQSFGPICPIPDQTSVGGDELVWPHRYWIQNEDCQVLNIWSHNIYK